MSGVSARAAWRVVVCLSIAGGLAAFVVDRLRLGAARPSIPLRAETWAATDARGEVLVAPPGDGFVLEPGAILRLTPATDERTELRRFGFRLRRALDQSSTVEIRLRDVGNAAYLVRVTPGATFAVSMSAPTPNGSPELLAHRDVPARGGDPHAPFDVEVRSLGPWFEVALDGKALFRLRHDGLAAGRASLVSDGVRVLSVRTETCAAGAAPDAILERVVDDLDFVRFGAPPASVTVARAIGVGAAIAALLFAFLGSLATGRFDARRVAIATTSALLPLAIVWIGAFAIGSTPSRGMVVAALAIGAAIGAFEVRDRVRDAAVPSRRRVAIAAVVLVACGWSLSADATAVRTRDAAIRADAVARALAAVSSRAEHVTQPFALDAGNAYSAAGPYRDVQLRTELALAPNAVVEVRLRGHPRIAEGIALLVSSRSDVPCGFVLEHRGDWRRLGPTAASIEPGRVAQLRVRARGDRFDAYLGGEHIAYADHAGFEAGNVAVLAAAGRADVATIDVTPMPAAEPTSADALPRLAGCGGVASLLPLAAALAFLLRRSWLRVSPPIAFAAIPIAALTHGEPLGLFDFAFVSFATLLVLLFATVAVARGVAPWRAVVAMVACSIAAPLAVAASHSIELEPPADDDPGPELVDGRSLPAGLVHLTSPVVRRFNTYLNDHRFRGRAFTTAKPEGVVRVLCLGTSSTWGHGIDESTGLDYPTQVERLLRERGLTVEVINAGIRASNSTRARYFFEEHLLPAFEPDIVTASFFLNESTHISQFDEPAFFERAQRQDFENTFLTRHALRAEIGRGAQRFATLSRIVREEKRDATTVWHELAGDVPTPADRFAQNMRRLVDLGRTHHFAVVLMKEPLRGDPPWLWKPEFHAAIDAIGAQTRSAVVDPTPALNAAGGRTLFLDLVHPTAEGHAIVARELAAALEPLVRAKASAQISR